MSYVCYLLNHMSYESLQGQIPLTKLYGVTPDIGIVMMHTFDQALQYKLTNAKLRKPCTNITLKDYELVLSKLISYFIVIMTDLLKYICVSVQ